MQMGGNEQKGNDARMMQGGVLSMKGFDEHIPKQMARR
jgi:hypothetical protein